MMHQHKVSYLDDQFRTLVEKTSALIFVIQKEKICYVNSVAEVTTGYSKSQLLTDHDFYHQLNPKNYRPNNLKPNCDELKIDLRGDKECWLKCCWEPIRWHCLPAIMVTAIDVTEYKQLLEIKTQPVVTTTKNKIFLNRAILAANSGKFYTSTQSEKRIISEHLGVGQSKQLNSILPISPHPQLKKVFDYIELHYHESIKLTDVATVVGYTPAYLTDLVKRKTGKTINRWIIKRRLAAAENLLKNSNYSIEQIAQEVGYSHPSHFFRQFRKYVGITPKVWRKAYRGY